MEPCSIALPVRAGEGELLTLSDSVDGANLKLPTRRVAPPIEPRCDERSGSDSLAI